MATGKKRSERKIKMNIDSIKEITDCVIEITNIITGTFLITYGIKLIISIITHFSKKAEAKKFFNNLKSAEKKQ